MGSFKYKRIYLYSLIYYGMLFLALNFSVVTVQLSLNTIVWGLTVNSPCFCQKTNLKSFPSKKHQLNSNVFSSWLYEMSLQSVVSVTMYNYLFKLLCHLSKRLFHHWCDYLFLCTSTQTAFQYCKAFYSSYVIHINEDILGKTLHMCKPSKILQLKDIC